MCQSLTQGGSMNDMELLQRLDMTAECKETLIKGLERLKKNRLFQTAVLSNYQSNQDLLQSDIELQRILHAKRYCLNKLSESEIEHMLTFFIAQMKGGMKNDKKTDRSIA